MRVEYSGEGAAGRAPPDEPAIVLLHGFDGLPEDLAPFARSLGIRARFIFPEAPIDLSPRGLRGRAWWPIDAAAAAGGAPRDLSGVVPAGLGAARACLERALDDARAQIGARPLVVGGFSQGAMLACDAVLRSARHVAGLALFSGARVAAAEWRPLYGARRGLRVFASHGSADRELSFEAARAFQAELAGVGWDVTWVPFEGGHEIPLVVWRAFRKWLTPSLRSSP